MFIKPRFRLVPDNTRIQFMRGRYMGLIVSAILSTASVDPVLLSRPEPGHRFLRRRGDGGPHRRARPISPRSTPRWQPSMSRSRACSGSATRRRC